MWQLRNIILKHWRQRWKAVIKVVRWCFVHFLVSHHNYKVLSVFIMQSVFLYFFIKKNWISLSQVDSASITRQEELLGTTMLDRMWHVEHSIKHGSAVTKVGRLWRYQCTLKWAGAALGKKQSSLYTKVSARRFFPWHCWTKAEENVTERICKIRHSGCLLLSIAAVIAKK